MSTHEIQIPLDPADIEGPFWMGQCEVLGQSETNGIADLAEVDGHAVKWLEEYDTICFEVLPDGGALRAIRKAAEEDFRAFRVPLWIQSEEVPDCCGQPMFFIGQLNDDTVCMERPLGSRLWWHDAASFYVFTCSRCLSVKAVGQQY